MGCWLDAALPEAVVSPPHVPCTEAMEGVSSVSRLSAGAPQVGRVITLPGTRAYWTVRLLLAGRANVFANLDSNKTGHSQTTGFGVMKRSMTPPVGDNANVLWRSEGSVAIAP